MAFAANPEAVDAEQGEKQLSLQELQKLHTYKVVESYMPSDYEQTAVEVSLEGVHKHRQYKDIACHIKQQFDKRYPSSGKATEGVYHCICGKNFASEWMFPSMLQQVTEQEAHSCFQTVLRWCSHQATLLKMVQQRAVCLRSCCES